jgi:Methyltransferase domain
MNTKQLIDDCISAAGDRYDFWVNFINTLGVRNALEVGIFRGDFSEKMLQGCECLEKYYMLDPWRNLDGWDKPANADNKTLELLMQRSLERTEFASNRRIVLRGKTTEVIDEIPDHSLDFAYIDGDHTLKGITLDLMRVYPKIKAGGYIGGDDFCPGELQHFPRFEPTLVFPFAIYFAEAVSARIYTLPYEQFVIEKSTNGFFELVDLAGTVTSTGLKDQMLKAMQGIRAEI